MSISILSQSDHSSLGTSSFTLSFPVLPTKNNSIVILANAISGGNNGYFLPPSGYTNYNTAGATTSGPKFAIKVSDGSETGVTLNSWDGTSIDWYVRVFILSGTHSVTPFHSITFGNAASNSSTINYANVDSGTNTDSIGIAVISNSSVTITSISDFGSGWTGNANFLHSTAVAFRTATKIGNTVNFSYSGTVTFTANNSQSYTTTLILKGATVVTGDATTITQDFLVTADGVSIPWSGALSINGDFNIEIVGSSTGQGISPSWIATTDNAGASPAADAKPGSSRRTTLRFPIIFEIPPLSTITSVELRGNCSVAGGATGQWDINGYLNLGDPEQDTFSTQYTNAGNWTNYVLNNTQWRSTGSFTIDLGPIARYYVQQCAYPLYGFFSLGLVEKNGATPPTLDNLSLVVKYVVNTFDGIPLERLATVSILSKAVPPKIADHDIGEYAIRGSLFLQKPGSIQLTLPVGSNAQLALEEMGYINFSILGYPIICALQEKFTFIRNGSSQDNYVTVTGQSIHKILSHRHTGPFPGSFNYDENLGLTAIGSDTEVFTTGDVSVRGSAYGSASASVESVLLKLMKTHTIQSAAGRKDNWINNLSFGPDNRRGTTNATTIATRWQPLLKEVERLITRTDIGYAVLLDAVGRFRVFPIIGIDRTGLNNRWFISTELNSGMDYIEVERDSSNLVTHVLVAGSGSGSTRNVALYKQIGGLESIYGRRETVIDAANAATQAQAELQARAYMSSNNLRRTVQLGVVDALKLGWLSAFNIGDTIYVSDPITNTLQKVKVYGVEFAIGNDRLLSASLQNYKQLSGLEESDQVTSGVAFYVGSNPLEPSGTYKEISQSALR